MTFVVFIDRVNSHSLMINFMIKKILYIYIFNFSNSNLRFSIIQYNIEIYI